MTREGQGVEASRSAADAWCKGVGRNVGKAAGAAIAGFGEWSE